MKDVFIKIRKHVKRKKKAWNFAQEKLLNMSSP